MAVGLQRNIFALAMYISFPFFLLWVPNANAVFSGIWALVVVLSLFSYDKYKLLLRFPGYNDGWEQDGTLGIVISDTERIPEKRNLHYVQDSSDVCPFTRGIPYNFTLFGVSSRYGVTQDDRVYLFNVYGKCC